VPRDEGVLAELKREYVAYAARTAFVRAEPAIVDMLSALRSSGLKLAVVTNANDLDSAPWAKHELSRFFDVFIASHQVRLMKPDRRIYELACERLQVEPRAASFVGDGGSNELSGAREAGIAPLWCTWFLDRWPEGIRPNGFPGDDWRQRRSTRESPYRRLARPPTCSPLCCRDLGVR
jgi:putative hydrolase of the HAD superfamily